MSLTTCHVILSGSFLDAGVKKLETAFSTSSQRQVLALDTVIYLLVVVDSTTFRFFVGGGDKDSPLRLRESPDVAMGLWVL